MTLAMGLGTSPAAPCLAFSPEATEFESLHYSKASEEQGPGEWLRGSLKVFELGCKSGGGSGAGGTQGFWGSTVQTTSTGS